MVDAEQTVEQVPQEVTLDEKQIVVVRTLRHTHARTLAQKSTTGNNWIRIYGHTRFPFSIPHSPFYP
jgi:hypothetical protein